MNITEEHQREGEEKPEIFADAGKMDICTQKSEIAGGRHKDRIGKVSQRKQKQKNKKTAFQERFPCPAQKDAVAELHQTEEQNTCVDRVCEDQKIVCTDGKEKGAGKQAHLRNVQKRKMADHAEQETEENKNVAGRKIHNHLRDCFWYSMAMCGRIIRGRF